MKYCRDCAKKKDYPITINQKEAICDICEEPAMCSDSVNPEEKKKALKKEEEANPESQDIHLQGEMGFAISLGPNLYNVGFDINNENNFIAMECVKKVYENILEANENSKQMGAPKNELISQIEVKQLKQSIRLLKKYISGLAAEIYNVHKHTEKPKSNIEIVSPMKNLKS